MNQRWESRRPSFRPAAETIRPSEYEVGPIARQDAKAFVVRHHYSSSFPAARFSYGLYRRGALSGVAVFSHPCNDAVLARVFGKAPATELGRFVLLDSVPGNGETWFLARAFRELEREGVEGVVSFSDPVQRTAADGRLVMPGHVGTIYQAHNGLYLGRGEGRLLRILPDGTALHSRAISKIRSRDRGWRYASAALEARGAAPLKDSEDAAAWLNLWIPRLTRPLRHAGNHKYAWALARRLRARMPAGRPFPKVPDLVLAAS